MQGSRRRTKPPVPTVPHLYCFCLRVKACHAHAVKVALRERPSPKSVSMQDICTTLLISHTSLRRAPAEPTSSTVGISRCLLEERNLVEYTIRCQANLQVYIVVATTSHQMFWCHDTWLATNSTIARDGTGDLASYLYLQRKNTISGSGSCSSTFCSNTSRWPSRSNTKPTVRCCPDCIDEAESHRSSTRITEKLWWEYSTHYCPLSSL